MLRAAEQFKKEDMKKRVFSVITQEFAKLRYEAERACLDTKK